LRGKRQYAQTARKSEQPPNESFVFVSKNCAIVEIIFDLFRKIQNLQTIPLARQGAEKGGECRATERPLRLLQYQISASGKPPLNF